MNGELSREEYKLLVEKAPIMIWRANVTMECDYFNEIWLAFTGRPMEQETGNGWAEGVHPEDFGRCLKIYTEHFTRREIFEMEYRLRRYDGVYRWIFDRGVPYSDSEGNFKGYIGSCIDVTERREAREALKRAQELEIEQLRELTPHLLILQENTERQELLGADRVLHKLSFKCFVFPQHLSRLLGQGYRRAGGCKTTGENCGKLTPSFGQTLTVHPSSGWKPPNGAMHRIHPAVGQSIPVAIGRRHR